MAGFTFDPILGLLWLVVAGPVLLLKRMVERGLERILVGIEDS